MGLLRVLGALAIAIHAAAVLERGGSAAGTALAVALRSCEGCCDVLGPGRATRAPRGAGAFIGSSAAKWKAGSGAVVDGRRASALGRSFAKAKEEDPASTDDDLDGVASDVFEDEVGYDDIYDEDSEYGSEEEEDEEDEEGSTSEYDSDEEAGNSAFDYNARGELMLPNLPRLSRTRVSRNRHKLFRGSVVHLSDLVYPLVVHDKESSESVPEVPGLRLLSIADLVKEVEEARNLGLTSFMIHPHIDKALRSQFADEGLNPDGLLPRAIDAVKEAFPDVQVFADASVAHFSLDGHDGLVEPQTDFIANDVSVSQVAKQVTTLASAGCDVVSLNDTLDGTVGVARDALDFEGFTDVSLMSRAGKFNSVLMAQQRKLLGMTPSENVRPESYLHDVAVDEESIMKGMQDVDDGADLVAVEPATGFLDVIRNLKDRLRSPVVAVHTTGEYRALKAAAAAGVFDERAAALEAIRGLRRAGADVIISSFSKDVAQWLLEDMQTNGMEHPADPLPENPQVVRGRLPNGLEYTLLPNANHCERLEAYLEVMSGSADELDHQRGVAHFCEHVTYMGSRKRDALVGRDVRTNAFTDFHHTVFYASCPSSMEGCGGREGSLERALEALADVVVAPTQFTASRVEKERQAILSEARIINTLEYRKNCATVEALHSETRLSRRFPIGDLDALERYSVQDLADYHRIHYRPSNLRLFLVGDIAPDSAIRAVERVFAGMQEDRELVDRYMREHADIYQGTVKESRWGLPPARHIWDQPGPIAHVWQNGQIRNLSLEVVRKMPIPTILTCGDMRQSLLMKLAYRIMSLNFDILQRGAGSLESVEANDYDCTNEGCRVRSFEFRCAPYQWREALSAAVAQAKCLATQGATHEMFSLVRDSMLLDCSRLDSAKADNRDVIAGLMDAATCGRTVMLPDAEKELVTDMLHSVRLDDVNDMASRLFPWSSGESFSGIHLICSTPPPDPSIGYDGVTEELVADAFESECREPLSAAALNPNVNTPLQLLSDEERREVVGRRPYGEAPSFVANPMLPKERYARPEEPRDEVLRSLAVGGDLRLVSERYIDAVRDSFKLRSDIEYITENKETPSELSRIGERLTEGSSHLVNEREHGKYTQALANLRKPLASTLDPGDVLYRERPGPAGIHLLTLGNSIRVNLRVGEGDQMAMKAVIPIEYDYCNQEALLRRKRELLLAANAMMEGGAMGSLSRLQVEMFCSQHLIDVMIGANEDYFSIEMSFPYGRQGRRGGNLESALQIMHALLQHHRIEPDALARAKDKLRRDRDVYAQDLQAYGTADLVSAMSEGKLTYHNLDMAAIGESKLEDIQATLDGIFKRGAVELSMSGAFDLQAAKSLLLQYIGTVQLPESAAPAPDRYQLWRHYDTASDDAADKGARFTTVQDDAVGPAPTGGSGSEASDAPASPEERHRLILVPDNQERAMVLVGGYAPNASGIMPDGTHMADIMHAELYATLATDRDVNNNVEKLVRTAKELWLHPAFPRAACALLQEILNNRSFTVLRAEKHLTYESNVDFVLYDVQFAGYFVISVHSSFDKSESILEETRNLVAELRAGIRPVTEHHLQRARDQVIARLRKDRTAHRHWVGELLGTQSRRVPLKSSLFCTEFERVLRRITLDDVHLMFGSNAFGFGEEHMWSRVVHTAVG